MSTSVCEENVQSQEQIGVPILKNGSQSHFIVNCGGSGTDREDGDENDSDSIWREVICEGKYKCHEYLRTVKE